MSPLPGSWAPTNPQAPSFCFFHSLLDCHFLGEAFPDHRLPVSRIFVSFRSTHVLTLYILCSVCLPTLLVSSKKTGVLFYHNHWWKPRTWDSGQPAVVSDNLVAVSPFWTVDTYNWFTYSLGLMIFFYGSMHGLLLFNYVVIFVNVVSTHELIAHNKARL